MNRAGAALLEAVMAIAILGAVGIAVLGVMTSTMSAIDMVEKREREITGAERVLGATSLLTRRELERRLGVRRVGEFVVWVDRPERGLFRIGVAPALVPARELLVTLVHRPMEEDPDG